MIIKLGISLMGIAFIVAVVFTIGSTIKFSTKIAVKETAGRVEAETKLETFEGIFKDVKTRKKVQIEIQEERRSNAGRSCPDYNECLRSNRNGSENCKQFLPNGPDNKPVDCSKPRS